MAGRRGEAPVVILYSTSRHLWEAWQESRPIAESRLPERLQAEYPDAMLPEHQHEIEAADRAARG